MPRMSWFSSIPAAAALLVACSGSSPATVSSRAYKGHENEGDTTTFVSAYPKTVGTRLDDCQTCHKGGTFTVTQTNPDSTSTTSTVTKLHCDFCHLIQHPDTTPSMSYNPPQPTSGEETLNAFGLAYKAAGRTKQALLDLDGQDSDGDGFGNGAEVAEGRYPGDPSSKPGQPFAPQKILDLEQIRAMPSHSEFLLANSTKQQFDDYATYKGVKIRDLLNSLKPGLADDPNVTGITVFAPDGFTKSRPVAKINAKYPNGRFYAGLDTASLGTTCGFVNYPSPLPAGVVDGGEIPGEQWLTLAYERDDAALDPSNLDPTSGKINGEGPYRFIVPQLTPAKPDRGSQYKGEPWGSQCSDNFVSTADHNAGEMARGVIALRIDPMPSGFEEFDARNGGWAYIDRAEVIVYGYGIE